MTKTVYQSHNKFLQTISPLTRHWFVLFSPLFLKMTLLPLPQADRACFSPTFPLQNWRVVIRVVTLSFYSGVKVGLSSFTPVLFCCISDLALSINSPNKRCLLLMLLLLPRWSLTPPPLLLILLSPSCPYCSCSRCCHIVHSFCKLSSHTPTQNITMRYKRHA